MTIKEVVLNLFDEKKELTVKEITEKTNASKQMVHVVLNNLIANGIIQKLGSTPKTSYRKPDKEDAIQINDPLPQLTARELNLLNNGFLIVNDLGNLLRGAEAFYLWCSQHKLPFEKALVEFEDVLKTEQLFYNKFGVINATDKLLNTKGYDKIWLDNLFYLAFNKRKHFGRTPLGTLMYYAKEGQSRFLMTKILEEIKTPIHEFINLQDADAIAFVPSTIKRELQLMKFLQSNLNLQLPIVEIKKVGGLIPVPQKSITKIESRIRNAENTYVVTDTRSFKHVVLIDNLVESGATLNQIAGKIKLKGIAAEVTGLGIVGSFGGVG